MCPDRRLRQISLRPKSRPWTWFSLYSTNDGKQHDERLQLAEDARSGGRIDWTNLPRKWFGPSGLELVEEVPQFEGCS